MVLKVRISLSTLPSAVVRSRQATTNFLWMSNPQQRLCKTRMTPHSSPDPFLVAVDEEANGMSAETTDSSACCPRWGATTASA